MIYNIILFPAKYGDSIIIEYGIPESVKRVLIDGGTGGTRKHILKYFEHLPFEQRVFELVIVTHVDRDHIEGILKILEQESVGFNIKEIWFNGWKHLPEHTAVEEFGAEQGERLTAAILKHNLNWNGIFNGSAVVIRNMDDDLPVVTLDGGFKITLLSPTVKELQRLRPVWKREVLKAGLVPGFGSEQETLPDNVEIFGIDQPDVEELLKEIFKEDDSEANGSSIAFIGEYSEKKVLFGGDSFPTVILNSINKLQPEGKYNFDLIKISHHASHGNTSPALLEKLDSGKFAISTNGSIYHHPAKVTIARIISSRDNAKLFFNYCTDYNLMWDSSRLKRKHNYETEFADKEGIKISLI